MPESEKQGVAGIRKFWLDACRSIAITMVLLSHGRHFLTPTWEAAATFRIGGFLGVELFFVLSGFLVGGIAWNGFKHAAQGQSWIRSFLLRRWLRTLPNYYLFIGVNALLISLAVVPGHVSDLLPFMGFTQNLAWPGPVIFGEAWSLSVEEVFYLIFPLGLYFLGMANPDRKKVFLTITLLLIVVPLLARMWAIAVYDPRWDDGIRKVVVFRLDALMIGVLTGWLVHEHRLLERMNQVFIALAALLVLSSSVAIYFASETTINGSLFARIWLFPLVSFGCALAILSGLNWTRPPSMLGKALADWARWSYALYLVHMPVFHLIVYLMGDTPPADELGAIARWVLFIAGSSYLAALVERHFERPILNWRDRNVPR